MDILEEYEERELSGKRKYTCIERDGTRTIEEQEVLVECEIDLYVGGEWEKRLVCSPQYLSELVLGHLYTEGLMDTIHGIELVSEGNGIRAEVCGQRRRRAPELQPLSPIMWKPEWIFGAADRFAEGMPLHEKTWATHSCFLLCENEILFVCEDLGRHNAFDKVVGYALKNGIDLAKCMIYSSGRIPVDMAKKAIMSGIPLLAAKAVPTQETIQLAKEYGLTLIGAARSDRMKIYTEGAAL